MPPPSAAATAAATLLALGALLAPAAAAAAAAAAPPLRRDGVPVSRAPAGQLRRDYARVLRDGYPWKDFSKAYVAKALKDPKNWTAEGLVTPVKDQGPHGYCGTFGRVGAAEGQYAMRKGGPLTSFSEEELVDCIGWDQDRGWRDTCAMLMCARARTSPP